MKLTLSGSGNTNVSGIIRPESQYDMYPYEQIKLANPYDILEGNSDNLSLYKVENYAPANFVNINNLVQNSPVDKLLDYISRFPEIKSKSLYVESNGQVTTAQNFLLRYFQEALNNSTLEGYSYEITGEGDNKSIIIKDANGTEVTVNEDDQALAN